MFTLRIVHKDKAVSNQSLGDNYTVTHMSTSPDQFEKLFKDFKMGALKNPDSIYAILTGAHCKEVWPITSNRQQFIMTESGKTFEKL